MKGCTRNNHNHDAIIKEFLTYIRLIIWLHILGDQDGGSSVLRGGTSLWDPDYNLIGTIIGLPRCRRWKVTHPDNEGYFLAFWISFLESDMFLDKFDTPKTRQIAFAKTFSLIQRFYISIGVIASVGSCVLKKYFSFLCRFFIFFYFLMFFLSFFFFAVCVSRLCVSCHLSRRCHQSWHRNWWTFFARKRETDLVRSILNIKQNKSKRLAIDQPRCRYEMLRTGWVENSHVF